MGDVSGIAAADRPLLVSEVFGPTFQGEGMSVGRRCGFVRLGGCNLTCTWCDTPYSWDWKRYDRRRETRQMTAAAVMAELDRMSVRMVVVTGGEPLLQQRRLPALFEAVKSRGWHLEVETNGTVAPAPATASLVDRFNVSPKLANSGVAERLRLRPDALLSLQATGKAVFKFVVSIPADLDEVADIVTAHGLDPVFVMPEGKDETTLERRMQSLAEAVLARGWNLTTRLHVLVWGNRRGV